MAVADRYRRALSSLKGSLTLFPLTGYDRTGVPVVATVWDPADGSGDVHGVGYGASEEAATVGALGETAERAVLGPALRRAQTRWASYREMVERFGSSGVADPVRLTLPAGTGVDDDRPWVWTPTTRWRTGETVWVPVEFVAFDHGSLPAAADLPTAVTPISNGLGAGDTLTRAVGHALLELVQRDGDTVSFRALDAGAVIELDRVADSGVRDLVERYRGVGVEPVVKLASTEFATVVYCTARDRDPDVDPMVLGAVGEAAHPDSATAVAKALLEYGSSRARRVFAFGPLERVRERHPDYLAAELDRPLGEQEPRAVREMAAWCRADRDEMTALLADRFDRRITTVDPGGLPTSPPLDPDALLELMLARLADFDVLVASGSDPDGNIHAVKVIVPGLEVETLSYHRIGERVARRLLDRGDSRLVGHGPPDRPGRRAVALRPDAVERLGGPVWFDVDAADRAVGALYPLYREPRRHAPQRLGLA